MAPEGRKVPPACLFTRVEVPTGLSREGKAFFPHPVTSYLYQALKSGPMPASLESNVQRQHKTRHSKALSEGGLSDDTPIQINPSINSTSIQVVLQCRGCSFQVNSSAAGLRTCPGDFMGGHLIIYKV